MAFIKDANMEAFVQDEDILLRCASTYNWDALEERCALIHDILTTREDSEQHQIRVAAAVHQLQARDQWNNTVLHICAFHNCAEQVVESLLAAASAANPPIPLTTFQSGDGSTPLLIACATGASSDVIGLLVQEDGNLAGLADHQGLTPLAALCDRYEQQRSQMRMNTPPALTDITFSHVTNEAFQFFIQTVKLLLREGTPPDLYHSLLHGAAYMGDSCPKDLSYLLCPIYPRLPGRPAPLHLAVNRDDASQMHETKRQHLCDMISALLKAHPADAKLRLENNCTPFSQAVASGLYWHDTLGNDGPLARLYECAPEALSSRDTQTGLYPFLLAAMNDEDDSLESIDSVYCLLRGFPQALQESTGSDY